MENSSSVPSLYMVALVAGHYKFSIVEDPRLAILATEWFITSLLAYHLHIYQKV